MKTLATIGCIALVLGIIIIDAIGFDIVIENRSISAFAVLLIANGWIIIQFYRSYTEYMEKQNRES